MCQAKILPTHDLLLFRIDRSFAPAMPQDQRAQLMMVVAESAAEWLVDRGYPDIMPGMRDEIDRAIAEGSR